MTTLGPPGTNPIMKSDNARRATSSDISYSSDTYFKAGVNTEEAKVEHAVVKPRSIVMKTLYR